MDIRKSSCSLALITLVSLLTQAKAMILYDQDITSSAYVPINQGKESSSRAADISDTAGDESATARKSQFSLSASQQKYYDMSYDMALSYAESDGVKEANLNPPQFIQLFTSLIKQESNFNPKAVSHAGAKGLGQLMPGTAKDLGVKDVFSPKENLRGAATYLVDNLNKFKSVSLALAAYNAGPGRVTQYGGVPPFRETRDYIAKISKFMKIPLVTKPEVKAQPEDVVPPPTKDIELKGTKSVWEF